MPRKDAFKKAIESYLEEVERTRSSATHRVYRDTLRRWHRSAREAGVTTYVSRWGLGELTRLLARRSHLLPSTLRTEVAILRSMLRHAGIPVLDEALRSGRLRLPPRSRVNVRWYAEDSLALVRANCQSDAQYIVVVLASELGLRRSEIVKLRVRDIQGDVLIVHGKGSRIVPLPITNSLRQTIDAWMLVRQRLVLEALERDPTTPLPEELIIHRRGARLSGYHPKTVHRMVSKVGRRMGVRLCPHDLRRSCGRELYKATGDIIAVNRLLRHASLDQTREYVGADLEDARRAMEARERKRAPIAPSMVEPVYEA